MSLKFTIKILMENLQIILDLKYKLILIYIYEDVAGWQLL